MKKEDLVFLPTEKWEKNWHDSSEQAKDMSARLLAHSMKETELNIMVDRLVTAMTDLYREVDEIKSQLNASQNQNLDKNEED